MLPGIQQQQLLIKCVLWGSKEGGSWKTEGGVISVALRLLSHLREATSYSFRRKGVVGWGWGDNKLCVTSKATKELTMALDQWKATNCNDDSASKL